MHDTGELGQRVERGRGDRLQSLQLSLGLGRQRGRHQLVLGPEVVHDERRGQPELRGDVGHAVAVNPALAHQLPGRGEDLRAAHLSVGPLHRPTVAGRGHKVERRFSRSVVTLEQSFSSRTEVAASP